MAIETKGLRVGEHDSSLEARASQVRGVDAEGREADGQGKAESIAIRVEEDANKADANAKERERREADPRRS